MSKNNRINKNNTEIEGDKVSLPERLYYPLIDAAKKLKCEVSDLLHLGATGVISISLYVEGNKYERNERPYLNMSRDKEVGMRGFESKGHGQMVGNMWSIRYIELIDTSDDGALPVGNYAGYLSGFFRVNNMDLMNAEFNSADTIRVRKLHTGKHGGEDDVVVDFFIQMGREFPFKHLCIMSEEIKSITGREKGEIPPPSDLQYQGNRRSENQQAKLIKALIEIYSGAGSSESPAKLFNEERGTGELYEDMQKLGIKPPMTRKTLENWLRGVELEYIEDKA